MKTEIKVKRMEEKVKKAETLATEKNVNTTFELTDSASVQTQLRIGISSKIVYNVDQIHYPKNLSGDDNPLWSEMYAIKRKIVDVSWILNPTNDYYEFDIHKKRKNGPEKREEQKNQLYLEKSNEYLKQLRKACLPSNLKIIRNRITTLQTKQKALLPKLRKANSEYLAGKRAEKVAKQEKNTQALAEGKFWDADKDALKDYFNPPFERNYLVDTSEQWRAALYIECASISYKDNFGNWRHKLSGTNNGYLCGIDDNGDEWGHEVTDLNQAVDYYDNQELSGTVEEAMAEIFEISETKLENCQRQGDLLFCKEKIPENVELTQHTGAWEIRESHMIESKGLQRNGLYFKSEMDIHISHTSHAPITLPFGEYRLYESQMDDVD